MQASTDALWNGDPRIRRGTIHIYSRDNDTSKGYDEYLLQSVRKNRKDKVGSSVHRIAERAMSRVAPTEAWLAFRASQSTRGGGEQSSQAAPSASGAGASGQTTAQQAVGVLKTDNQTPCYWSTTSQAYYRHNHDMKLRSVKATDIKFYRQCSEAGPSVTSSGSSSQTTSKRAVGVLKADNRTPCYWSATSKIYYRTDSKNKRHGVETKNIHFTK